MTRRSTQLLLTWLGGFLLGAALYGGGIGLGTMLHTEGLFLVALAGASLVALFLYLFPCACITYFILLALGD